MTDEQYKLLQRLAGCTFLPGSWEKRFVRNLSAEPKDYELSAKQLAALERLHYRYRRQLGEPDMLKPLAFRKEDELKAAQKLARWNAGQAYEPK